MVSRAAKVNCTDLLIVLWAWHLVATPGRAKQAKVKSASLVKALLTTHPQGEETWGSFLALRGPTSRPAFPGGAPAAARGASQRRSAHLRPARAQAVPPSPASQVWKYPRCSFCSLWRLSDSSGERVVKLGVRGRNSPHAPVLESGNKHFRRAFCKDLA